MKTLFFITLISFLLGCSEHNKKLSQEKADEVIRSFVDAYAYSPSQYDIAFGAEGSFSKASITEITPISQFTEDEAFSQVKFHFKIERDCPNLILKFNFTKNIDDIWMLTSIEGVQGIYCEGGSYAARVDKMIEQNQHINIPVE